MCIRDRLQREEHYTLRIAWKKGEPPVSHELQTEREFLAWKKGQPVSVTVTNGGEVKALRAR